MLGVKQKLMMEILENMNNEEDVTLEQQHTLEMGLNFLEKRILRLSRKNWTDG